MEGFLLETLSCRMPAAAARRRTGGECPRRHPVRTDCRPRPVQHETAQRPRRHHPNAPGPAARRRRQISYGVRSGQAPGAPAAHSPPDGSAKPRNLSVAAQHHRHRVLGGRRRHGAQSGSQPQKFLGFRVEGKLRRVRQSGPPAPHDGFPAQDVHPQAESLLCGSSLQRRLQGGAQAGSLPRHSLVPPGILRKRTIRLQGKVGANHLQQAELLCPMGGLRPVHHGGLAYVLATSPPSTPTTRGPASTFPLPFAIIWAFPVERPSSTGALWNSTAFPAAPGPSGETTTPLSIPVWGQAREHSRPGKTACASSRKPFSGNC